MWWLALLFTAAAPGPGQAPRGTELMVSPRIPGPTGSARVLAVAEEPLEGASLEAVSPAGVVLTLQALQGGGPPWWWQASWTPDREGTWTIRLVRAGRVVLAREVAVLSTPPSMRRSPGVWDVERPWDRGTENLFSAWVERLFDHPEGTHWPDLDQVTGDPARNLLHGHLGLGEDDAGSPEAFPMNPDCADNPYFLRAYFAWKLGLPFGYHTCTRGTSPRSPPECSAWTTNGAKRSSRRPGRAFHRFLRGLQSAVHAATGRTAYGAEETDLYPIPLTREALRPGTVYPDPYGHTFTLVRWVPQQGDEPGMLLAVDAQPDGTVEIKRFWRGNFLFASSGVIGGPGFKAWRPVVPGRGGLQLLTNAALRDHPDFAPFSLAQASLEPAAFYDAMDRAINPLPQDPVSSFRRLHEALHQQLVTRVRAVDLGVQAARGRTDAIPMPEGPAIFRTTGPWEDFSTPARDLRLLVAVDTVLDFPDRVVRDPAAFRLPPGRSAEDLRRDLLALGATWREELSVAYPRSDGSEVRVCLAELLARAEALELAWNPNDCPEIRWGAAEGTDEARTCAFRAPRDQRARMEKLRGWFRERRRPAW
ncbi:MAG: hypothetical protein FJ098_06585 [Deltaproteobacteria bacterium]|nr:hypothetical protein [Deltaproteobacteria bacterium]